MEYESVIRLTTNALMLALLVSIPAVAVAAGVGLLVAFLQAVLSMQDSSIAQGVKLVAVIAVLVVAAPWGASAILQFARSVMEAIFA